MELKTGMRLRSVADTTEVIVIRSPSGLDVRCGGHPMVPEKAEAIPEQVMPGFEGETTMGKRYMDAEIGVELLCTKSGTGALSLGDTLLPQLGAKPLPASD